jgi:hypothetical protein
MKKNIFVIALLTLLVYACNRKSQHTVMFYMCEACDLGGLSIYIDDRLAGTLDTYIDNCEPKTGETKNVFVYKPNYRSHTYTVKSTEGLLWQGSFSNDERKQVKIKLECSGSSNGSEITFPNNYLNKGSITINNRSITVCIKDRFNYTGDTISLFINGKKIFYKKELTGNFQCKATNNLSKGKNWIGLNFYNKNGIRANSSIEINDGERAQIINLTSTKTKTEGYEIIVN